jgi:hypothetical protein
MDEVDLSRPAIVFWLNTPGELTRFERLGDAVQTVMHTPSAKTASIAWIWTKENNIAMDEIRSIAKRASA